MLKNVKGMYRSACSNTICNMLKIANPASQAQKVLSLVHNCEYKLRKDFQGTGDLWPFMLRYWLDSWS